MPSEGKTDFVILGLLSHEDLTGYEIKKRMDTVLSYFWGAGYGSIYPSLNNLVKNENATKVETTENGRKKIIYSITEKGKIYLRSWLSVPAEKDEIRYETLLKLFFGSESGKDKTIEHINNFEDKIREQIPYLQNSVKLLKKIQNEEDAHKYYMLTAMFGEKVYNAYLEWCIEAKQLLEKASER